MLSKLISFFTTDIWQIRLKNVSGAKSFFIKQVRIIVLAVRGFDEDKCSLKASALTFYTLLSIVPVVAMVFGIAKGFGFEQVLEQQLFERLQGQKEVLEQIIAFAHSLLENTQGGLIAGIGVVILFWTVIKLLGNIESSLNDIWGISKTRSLGRKFSDYLSAILICPFLFIIASSITVAITSQIKSVVESIALLQVFSSFILSLLRMLPYCFVWVLFSFLYIFMPNTKVNMSAGILAGIIAGTLYQVVQWGYISFQIGVAKYNAIYGGFAALPLFLIWLELSWFIVLLGAEISFACQNVHTYEFEPDCLKVSHSFRRLLTLWIVHVIIKNFQKSEVPLTADGIIQKLELPARLVYQILDELVTCGVVNEIRQESDKSFGYQPARSIDMLTIKYVIDALEQHGRDNIPLVRATELDTIKRHMQAFSSQVDQSADNVCLKDI